MSKRNVSTHRKAMGFASELWDIDNNAPIDLRTTEADCIEHVRCQMYCFMREKKMRKKEGGVTDDEEEEEAVQAEDEILSEMQESHRIITMTMTLVFIWLMNLVERMILRKKKNPHQMNHHLQGRRRKS